MVFSSSVFLFVFLPILLIVYFLIPTTSLKNAILFVASIFFYAWGEPVHIFLMLGSIVINYFFGRFMEGKPWIRKTSFACAIIWNIGLLFAFKYSSFFVVSINTIFKMNIPVPNIALPIGISFYTFQILSYIIDVYRGEYKAQRNILYLGMYVSLFPQLIAGPIVRYAQIEGQLKIRKTDFNNIYLGLRRFTIGFSKKILIADQLSPLVDSIVSGKYPSILAYWIGAVAYTLQIYYDFCGYSDMAIGLGKVFGFEFPENFNHPYFSTSISEFWRRWHITLGAWFKDYVYIPLGGNRIGIRRTCVNLFVVFLLTGMWHGAGLNFLIWGIYYAVFIIAEKLLIKEKIERFPVWIGRIYTLIVVIVGWVIFRVDSMSNLCMYLRGMVFPSGKDFAYMQMAMNPLYFFVMGVGIFLSIPHTRLMGIMNHGIITKWIGDVVLIMLFAVAICFMHGSGFSPFLYYRF